MDDASYDVISAAAAPSVPLEELEQVLRQLELSDSGRHFSAENQAQLQRNDVTCDYLFRQDADGDNAFMLAIIHKRTDIVAKMLECVNSARLMNLANEAGQTALHLAVLVNLPRVVRSIVTHGGDVTALDRRGNTALHLACHYGYLECIQALTAPLRYDETQACAFYIPFIRMPQNCDVRNHDGKTCLQLAASAQHFRVIEHLVRHCNADINVCDWSNGNTLLHAAVQADNKTLCKFLLTFQMLNINAVRYDGLTALSLARVTSTETDVAVVLRNAGAFEPSAQVPADMGLMHLTRYDDIKIDGTCIEV